MCNRLFIKRMKLMITSVLFVMICLMMTSFCLAAQPESEPVAASDIKKRT